MESDGVKRGKQEEVRWEKGKKNWNVYDIMIQTVTKIKSVSWF